MNPHILRTKFITASRTTNDVFLDIDTDDIAFAAPNDEYDYVTTYDANVWWREFEEVVRCGCKEADVVRYFLNVNAAVEWD